jgi:hypothetical protein
MQTIQAPATAPSSQAIPSTTKLPGTADQRGPRVRARRWKPKSAIKPLGGSYQDPSTDQLPGNTEQDPIHVYADVGLKFPQLFGEMCKNIITEYYISSPPQANAHFEYVYFVDDIEKQFRKEYQHARFKTFDRFRTLFHLEAATDSKVVMLRSGYSEPKFFKVVAEWDTPHLVPVRLYSKDGDKHVEIRVDARWKRLPAFLDTLVRPQAPNYEQMHKYWNAVQEHTQSRSEFMALPLELRRNIYRYAVLSEGWTVRPRLVNITDEKIFLPGKPNAPKEWQLHYNQNLLVSSKQIRAEAVEEFYRTATFKFHDVADLDRFMKSYRPSNVTKIHLEFAMETHEFLVRDPEGYGTRHFKSPSVASLRVLTIEIDSMAVFAACDLAAPEHIQEEVDEQLKSVANEEQLQQQRDQEKNRNVRLLEAYNATVAHLKNCEVRLICHEASKASSEA